MSNDSTAARREHVEDRPCRVYLCVSSGGGFVSLLHVNGPYGSWRTRGVPFRQAASNWGLCGLRVGELSSRGCNSYRLEGVAQTGTRNAPATLPVDAEGWGFFVIDDIWIITQEAVALPGVNKSTIKRRIDAGLYIANTVPGNGEAQYRIRPASVSGGFNNGDVSRGQLAPFCLSEPTDNNQASCLRCEDFRSGRSALSATLEPEPERSMIYRLRSGRIWNRRLRCCSGRSRRR